MRWYTVLFVVYYNHHHLPKPPVSESLCVSQCCCCCCCSSSSSSSSSSSNSDPESSLQPKTEDDTGDSSEHTGDSSEPDAEHSADWKETREPASGSKSLKKRQESVSDPRRSAEKKPLSCSVCEEAFRHRRDLDPHMRIHTGEKPFGCSVCEKCVNISQNIHLYIYIFIIYTL